MPKLKLMQITHDLAIGGLQQIVVNLCRTIDRDRFAVSVLCLRSLGEFAPVVRAMGIEVLLLPQKPGRVDYLSFLKVAKILRERNIDIIHTHNTQPLIDGTLGALMSGVKTIVHTDHGRQFPDKKRYMAAERVMSQFVYRIVGVSEPTSRDLITHEKIAPHKVMTIHNGIDVDAFAVNIDRQAMKRSLGIAKKGPVIGLGARLSAEKGITYLLKAMPALIRKHPDITLLIAGTGDAAPALMDETSALGIADHVVFAGPRLDMPNVLKVLDLYVLPSLREGLPTVLLEAMAAGCPLVATNVGGNAMAVRHGENGSLVAAQSPEALAAEILSLLGSTQTMSRYAEAGLRTVRERFSAAVMTARYQTLYLREEASPAGTLQ